MELRQYKNSGEQVSLLGFGTMRLPLLDDQPEHIDTEQAQGLIDYALAHGVNYFDTAYPYHNGQSERFIGLALSQYPRDRFYLASKLPIWKIRTPADADRIFEEQLQKCRVEYFDYYLLHSLSAYSWETVEKLRLYERMLARKEQGQIRHLGFSFHDKLDLFQKIVPAHPWDFAQIQLNYVDWEFQNAGEAYRILTERNIPVIVMEPVRGGALATLSESAAAIFRQADPQASTASWAIRYAASLPNVLTVLSGMSNLAQVVDNVKTLSPFKALTPGEYDTIARALAAYRANATIPCTACGYCMDCPSGVDIPKVFAAYNQYCLQHADFVFSMDYSLLDEEKQAHHCTACNQCVERCPQGIAIPGWMAKIADYAKSLPAE